MTTGDCSCSVGLYIWLVCYGHTRTLSGKLGIGFWPVALSGSTNSPELSIWDDLYPRHCNKLYKKPPEESSCASDTLYSVTMGLPDFNHNWGAGLLFVVSRAVPPFLYPYEECVHRTTNI